MKRSIAYMLCMALLTCCLLAGAALPVSVSAATPNLLTGGDFEWETASGHWTSASSGYAVVGGTSAYTVVTDKTDPTNRCLQLPDGNHTNRYLTNVPLEGGKTYRISGRARGAGARIYFRATEIVKAGNYYPLGSATASSDTWVDFSFTFTTVSSLAKGNYSYAIAIGHENTTSGYLDDICLYEVVEATGIAFANGNNVTMAPEETKVLTLIGAPDGADLPEGTATWTSSNTGVATVDNGVVTAVSYGTAKITAALGDYKATCTVSVDKYAPVLLGDFEGELSANWAWDNATYGIINSASPMKIATEDNGNKCLSLPALATADATGYTAYYRTYKSAPVEGGKTYRLTLKYKGSGGGLYLLSNMVADGSGYKALSSADGWKTYTCEFTTKDSVTNKAMVIGFRHAGSTADTLYIDDVTLSLASPFENQLIDGDLETEILSDTWGNFESNTLVSRVDDTVDTDNQCYRFDGKTWPYFKGLSAVEANSSYKLSFRLRGNGKAIFYFHFGVEGSQVVSGASDYTVSGKYVYITTGSDAEWVECSIIFRTGETVNPNFIAGVGGYNNNDTYMYMDDFSLVALGSAYVREGISGGEVTLTAGENSGTILSDLHDGETAQTVTVTATPSNGYLLVPGSLKYTTGNGIVKRVLNKDSIGFGEGAGNTFAFEMPNENVAITAEFVSVLDTDFAWGTVGTAVHTNGAGTNDGIRFLNRIQLEAFDETAEGYTFTYNGEAYTVKEIGLLLKRTEATYTLDLETYHNLTHDVTDGSAKMWGVSVYNSDTNVMRAVDYTDTYVDFSIAMITSTPNEEFCERLYTARSYIVLEKGGEQTVLYANERTDSVNTTLQRAAGLLSDEQEVTSGGGAADPSTAIPEDTEALKNADLKVLTLGNSWGHNAHSYLADVAVASGKTFKCVNLFKSGCSLKQHYEGWKSNQPQYWYELNGVIDWNSAVTLKAALASDTWDVITLHAGPSESVDAANYQPYLNELVAMLKAAQPQATIYLMQTWAFGDDYAYLTDITGRSRAEMWSKIEPAFEQVIAETGMPVIPAGAAANDLENWFEENAPELSFYQADDSHAEETWGWYLLALVWYRALTGEEPANTFAAFDKSYTDDAEIRAKVFEIAMAAVEEFYPVSEEVAA